MAEFTRDRFIKACEILGGKVEKKGPEDVCEIRPHENGLIQIILNDNRLREIFATNELANTSIRFPAPGTPIAEIRSNEEKRTAFFRLIDKNTCTLTRLPKIVEGVCIINGKIVEFRFDP